MSGDVRGEWTGPGPTVSGPLVSGPFPGPPPARRPRTGLWIGVVAAVVVGLLAVGGVLLLLSRGDDKDGGSGGSGASSHQGGNSAPGPVQQDLRFVLVEQSTPGGCTDDLPPPTFASQDPAYCYSVSTRAADQMTVERLDEVGARYDARAGGWIIHMTFRDEDAQRFTALTGRAAPREAPRNQIAILLGDRLLSAPTIVGPIPGGQVEITGSYTEESANGLARDLGAR